MGKITVKTKESAGQVTYETETIFESSEDYFYMKEVERETLSNALKSYADGLDFSFDKPLEDQPADNVTEIKVGKKKPEPTKH